MADFFEEDFEDLEGDTGEELPYVASTQEQTSQLKEREWNLLKERFKNVGVLSFEPSFLNVQNELSK